ncbi:DUF2927 domain-containing protein [Paracoccus suum]|nr:DUF2927 domain-containing protein [Paracoccus suum]
MRSEDMAGYLSRIEGQLLSRGLLRTDDGAAEGPLSADRLTEDFVQIALRDEYASLGAPSAGANATPAPLRRWAGDVRLQLEFGDSIPPEMRARDRQTVASYATRLAQAAQHPVSLVGSGGNFIVMVAAEDDRAGIPARIAALAPGIPPADAAALGQLSPQTFCTVFSYASRGDAAAYTHAVALIRGELPARLRMACFHEELAQGLGLPNDSPAARPSIFNDDEAFAALTLHDAALLRILYDPRLRPGMTETEARPIIATIAAEIATPAADRAPATATDQPVVQPASQPVAPTAPQPATDPPAPAAP